MGETIGGRGLYVQTCVSTPKFSLTLWSYQYYIIVKQKLQQLEWICSS